MKTRLSELTLTQFIELLLGNLKSIRSKTLNPNAEKTIITTRDIVLEYRAIADPGGNAQYFNQIDAWLKSRMKVMIFSMCTVLVAMEKHDIIKSILESLGVNASRWDEKRLAGTVKAKLAQAEREFKDFEKEQSDLAESQEDIRRYFDSQIASLMAHYKFQIDPDTIKATVYAHLVARYNREVKAQINAVRKK